MISKDSINIILSNLFSLNIKDIKKHLILTGGYPIERFWETCWKLYDNYGPIVRLAGVLPKKDIVYIFGPKDVQKLFQVRRCF